MYVLRMKYLNVNNGMTIMIRGIINRYASQTIKKQ